MHLTLSRCLEIPTIFCWIPAHKNAFILWNGLQTSNEILSNIQVPPNKQLFCSAGQLVHLKHIAYVFAKLCNYNRKCHHFCQVVLLHPRTPIPYVAGLDAAKTSSIDVKIREKKTAVTRFSLLGMAKTRFQCRGTYGINSIFNTKRSIRFFTRST